MKDSLESMNIELLIKLFIEEKADANLKKQSEISKVVEFQTGFDLMSASDREMRILLERFKSGSSEGLDISPENIRQIEDKALDKLANKDH